MTEAPSSLSVVIPAVNGWRPLEECLGALLRQAPARPTEILVVDRTGPAVQAQAAALGTPVHVIPAGPSTPIPRLRALGIRAATGDVAALIEDHVVVPPDWTSRMLAAHRAGAIVVGGPVVNGATETTRDWAAFLCEYHDGLRRRPAGPTDRLAGNNVTYRRDLVAAHVHLLDAGGWEDALHAALRRAGASLVYEPAVVARHCMRYVSAREYLEQRFLYSRAYAASRVAGAGWGARLAWVVATLGLPPVLLGRILIRVIAHPRPRPPLARPLPLLVLFSLAWALGEAVGSLFGPGDALERIR